MQAQHKKLLAFLLVIALVIIYVQVIIGGTTRLTGSGLSITDWKIVTGTIPPLNAEQWQEEFNQYKATPQYQEINEGMKMKDFQSIYFWEWLHRVWGRWGFMFIVFVFGYFAAKKYLDKTAVKRFMVFLVLYALQGLLGWFMVKSGLVDVPHVSHYRLTAHLLLALFLFSYILWWIADLVVPKNQKIINPKAQRFSRMLVGISVLQIVYGGFMSGLRAATHYPTFPDMNGELVPSSLFSMSPLWLNFFENVTTIQFVHRSIAYVLAALIVYFWYKNTQLSTNNKYFKPALHFLLGVLVVQVSLGITVLLLSANGTIPVGFGVAHQAGGLLLLSTLLFLTFQFQSKSFKA